MLLKDEFIAFFDTSHGESQERSLTIENTNQTMPISHHVNEAPQLTEAEKKTLVGASLVYLMGIQSSEACVPTIPSFTCVSEIRWVVVFHCPRRLS